MFSCAHKFYACVHFEIHDAYFSWHRSCSFDVVVVVVGRVVGGPASHRNFNHKSRATRTKASLWTHCLFRGCDTRDHKKWVKVRLIYGAVIYHFWGPDGRCLRCRTAAFACVGLGTTDDNAKRELELAAQEAND